jgi:metal-responsive CopG/Arc/MetJ family transcriptional regulator
MIEITTPGMISSDQEVAELNLKVSVSLPDSKLMLLDKLAKKWKTTRSGAVVELLRHIEQDGLEEELAEGYAALADSNKEDMRLFFHAQAEVVNRDES